ncbi:hypothetical protein LV779_14545 [Streptomyces thinghirensis]|nr:hypothetical protein [Streptomyces thinghirensis]
MVRLDGTRQAAATVGEDEQTAAPNSSSTRARTCRRASTGWPVSPPPPVTVFADECQRLTGDELHAHRDRRRSRPFLRAGGDLRQPPQHPRDRLPGRTHFRTPGAPTPTSRSAAAPLPVVRQYSGIKDLSPKHHHHGGAATAPSDRRDRQLPAQQRPT